MISIFHIRKKKKLYYTFAIEDKEKFIEHFKDEFNKLEVIPYHSEDNKFFPRKNLSVFFHFFFIRFGKSNLLDAIFKPAEKLFFIKYFHIKIEETKKGNYLMVSIDFQTLVYFLLPILFLFLLSSVLGYRANGQTEILKTLFVGVIGCLIYSVFYITLTIKALFKYIMNIISSYRP